jgi:hypothetical protein
MTIKIEAGLLGPFESPKKYVNRDSSFKESGIYIWTIRRPWDGRFLTNYVGETGTSFARRLLEHRRWYYTGEYRVYDPNKFGKGDKKIIWGGLWWFRKTISDEKLLDRIKAHVERGKGKYDKEIEKLLDAFKVFLIPLTYSNGLGPLEENNRRIRRRIEGALVRRLASNPDVFHFHDFTGEFTDKKENDEYIQLHLKNATQIIGLEENMRF